MSGQLRDGDAVAEPLVGQLVRQVELARGGVAHHPVLQHVFSEERERLVLHGRAGLGRGHRHAVCVEGIGPEHAGEVVEHLSRPGEGGPGVARETRVEVVADAHSVRRLARFENVVGDGDRGEVAGLRLLHLPYEGLIGSLVLGRCQHPIGCRHVRFGDGDPDGVRGLVGRIVVRREPGARPLRLVQRVTDGALSCPAHGERSRVFHRLGHARIGDRHHELLLHVDDVGQVTFNSPSPISQSAAAPSTVTPSRSPAQAKSRLNETRSWVARAEMVALPSSCPVRRVDGQVEVVVQHVVATVAGLRQVAIAAARATLPAGRHSRRQRGPRRPARPSRVSAACHVHRPILPAIHPPRAAGLPRLRGRPTPSRRCCPVYPATRPATPACRRSRQTQRAGPHRAGAASPEGRRPPLRWRRVP